MGSPIILNPDCPKCGYQTLTYNGNYYCTDEECGWALPDPIPAKYRILYKDMYVDYMRKTNREPDKETIQSILTGEP